jgi:hypothetical protein
VLFLISILAITYYPKEKARTLWKFAATCNALVLLFVIRMRIFRCLGYPLKYMKEMKACCVFTRIRMKLADYICFFYIFFAEMTNCAVLILKQYKCIEEKRCSSAMAIMNAMYLLFWIFCTNSRSFKPFPKD